MERSTTKILYKELSYEIQGAAIEVRKNFGPGHKENIYQNAFAEELTSRNISFEREKSIQIRSPKTGKVVGYYKPDFVIDGKILVELKALEKTPRLSIDQLYDYLRNSDYELGYFINFSTPKLLMRRIIFTNDRKFLNRTAKTFAALSFIFVVLGVGAFFGRARAISIKTYFNAPEEVAIGQEFPVKLLVDSDQPLNAYSIGVVYPKENLELLGFNNSRSIIDVWQKQPLVFEGGAVKFSGGSIAPFSGEKGELLTINLKAIKTGEVTLRFENATFYLANGKGTKVIPATKELNLSIEQFVAGRRVVAAPQEFDITAPEIKFLSIMPDPFNNNQKFLSFSVYDADSGTKNVQFRSREWLFWSEWQNAVNPTALKNNVWAINFKVIDSSGNVSEKVIYDWSAFWMQIAFVAGALAAIVFVSIFLRRRLWTRKIQEKIKSDTINT